MPQVAVAGQVWNYEKIEVGTRGLVPVIVLHGWGRSGKEWMSSAKELAMWSGRAVYVVDLPGFGGSGIPRVATIEEYSEKVAEFCAYLGLTKVILIGHSLGGRIGIVLGAKRSELIERLILIDPAGVKPGSIKRILLRSVANMVRWVPANLRELVVGKMMDEDYRNNPTLVSLYRAVVGGQDLRIYLPRIKCLTVVVWGENDPILPLSQTKLYKQLIPETKIRVVWGAGHDPHLTKYEQTLAILQEAVE